jgi:hypothetical protein
MSVPYIYVAVGLNIDDPSLDPSTCNTAGVGGFGSRDADLMHVVMHDSLGSYQVWCRHKYSRC